MCEQGSKESDEGGDDIRLHCQAEGEGCRITAELSADVEKQKPECWDRFKNLLRDRGFELSDGYGLAPDEVFLPSSFWAAKVGVVGVKSYADRTDKQISGDMTAILNCVGCDVDKGLVSPESPAWKDMGGFVENEAGGSHSEERSLMATEDAV